MSKQIPSERFELDGFQTSAIVRVMMHRIQKVDEQLEEAASEEAEADLEFLKSTYLRTVEDIERKLWDKGHIEKAETLHVYYPPEDVEAEVES